MKVVVNISLKEGVLDPEGQMVNVGMSATLSGCFEALK